MALKNFHFFAMHYLNDWCADDQRFVDGLSLEHDRETRLARLWEAAKYYKVTRTLPKLDGEARLAAALDAIDLVPIPVTEATVDDAVCRLASRFKSLYGRYAISAASKLLWLRHQWPVVILDERADLCLRTLGCSFRKGDYPAYRCEWRKRFNHLEPMIKAACDELTNVKRFSLAAAMREEEFAKLTGSRWFHERVFDKYLWWNAGTSPLQRYAGRSDN
jgi:hypothetical protein